MSTQISLENFEEIYEKTYTRVLRFIICKCSNLEDVNDLIQDTYVDLYSALIRRKYIELENDTNYVIGIANRKIKKHYGKIKSYSLYGVKEDEDSMLDIPADVDIEDDTLTKLNASAVWNYVKNKDIRVAKIFYLYYCLELKISEIAVELELSESNVKNLLYRTIKDIREHIKIEGDESVK